MRNNTSYVGIKSTSEDVSSKVNIHLLVEATLISFMRPMGAILVRRHKHINSGGRKEVGWTLMEQMTGLKFKERVRKLPEGGKA